MNELLARVRNGWSDRARLVGAGLVVGGVVSGGLLFATIPDKDGVLHGCYTKSGGAVRIIDNGVTACKASETAISWNVAGPKGTDGAPGSPGGIGPSDAFVVERNGNFSAQTLDGSTFTKMVSMSLPAGSYVVHASASLTGQEEFGGAQCGVTGSASFLGPLVQQTVGGRPNSFAAISLTAAFTLAAVDEVSLICRGSSLLQTQPSIMTAIQVQTLTDLSE